MPAFGRQELESRDSDETPRWTTVTRLKSRGQFRQSIDETENRACCVRRGTTVSVTTRRDAGGVISIPEPQHTTLTSCLCSKMCEWLGNGSSDAALLLLGRQGKRAIAEVFGETLDRL